eukprot:5213894-Alexandrium_andersonii.AAC.1
MRQHCFQKLKQEEETEEGCPEASAGTDVSSVVKTLTETVRKITAVGDVSSGSDQAKPKDLRQDPDGVAQIKATLELLGKFLENAVGERTAPAKKRRTDDTENPEQLGLALTPVV